MSIGGYEVAGYGCTICQLEHNLSPAVMLCAFLAFLMGFRDVLKRRHSLNVGTLPYLLLGKRDGLPEAGPLIHVL